MNLKPLIFTVLLCGCSSPIEELICPSPVSLSDNPPFYQSLIPANRVHIARFVEGKIRLRLKKYSIEEKEIRRIILGVFSNAHHESGWEPSLISSGNYGLFQLRKNGLGKGKSTPWLLDYKNNTTAILNCPQAIEFFEWAAGSGFSAGDFAYRFASKVERCSSKYYGERRATANWYQMELK